MHWNNATLPAATGAVGTTRLAIVLATVVLAVPRIALAGAAGESAPMVTGKLAGGFAAAILATLLCVTRCGSSRGRWCVNAIAI